MEIKVKKLLSAALCFLMLSTTAFAALPKDLEKALTNFSKATSMKMDGEVSVSGLSLGIALEGTQNPAGTVGLTHVKVGTFGMNLNVYVSTDLSDKNNPKFKAIVDLPLLLRDSTGGKRYAVLDSDKLDSDYMEEFVGALENKSLIETIAKIAVEVVLTQINFTKNGNTYSASVSGNVLKNIISGVGAKLGLDFLPNQSNKDAVDIKISVADSNVSKIDVAYKGNILDVNGAFNFSGFNKPVNITMPNVGNDYANAAELMDENDIQIYLHGKKLKIPDDSTPMIYNDRTMVPVRFLTEKMGGQVNWYVDSENKAHVDVKLNGKELKMIIGDKTAYLDGVAKETDTPPTIINDRTMIPLRFISENLGWKVVAELRDFGDREVLIVNID